ncbi:MAG: hypothetical protein JW958_01775 [Candidatus Eisenbacteria bacterium]|nr:hypothetical protein [Candidatus Eisenbacteria bacterium]
MNRLFRKMRWWWAPPLFLFLLGAAAPERSEASPAVRAALPDGLPAPAEKDTARAAKKPAKKKSSAKKKKKKKEEPKVRLSGLFALRFVFDDNFIHYSDEDLDEFAHTVNTGKFSIETAHDWIVRPRFEMTLETPEITGRDLEISFRASTWRYVNNGVKDNQSYQIGLKHAGFGRDNFQLSYYYAPLSYIRNFRDRAPYTSRSAPLEYYNFSYTSNSLTLGYWRRLSSAFDGKLEVKRSWRYFNREFMENDNWEWRFGGYLAWRFIRPLKLTFAYYYSDVLGRGADEAGETRENSNDSDPTYVRDAFDLTLRFYTSGILPKINALSVGWEYQTYYFTGEKPYYEDPLHTGRKDLIRRVEVTGETGRIFGPLSLEAGYRYTMRTSDAAWTGGTDDAGIGEEKDYVENRTWLGLEYPF